MADYVVTDYSAITIEAAALEKQIYFYVYDYEQYCESNGLNLDLFELFPTVFLRTRLDLCIKSNKTSMTLTS